MSKREKIRILVLVICGAILLRTVEAMTPNVRYGKVFYRYGIVAEKEHNTEKAILYYKKALQSNPGLPAVFLRLGKLLFKEGRFDEAKGYLLRATYLADVSEEVIESAYYLGFIFFQEGYYQRALDFFERAIRYAHDAPRQLPYCLLWKAITYLSVGDYLNALFLAELIEDAGDDTVSSALWDLMVFQRRSL